MNLNILVIQFDVIRIKWLIHYVPFALRDSNDALAYLSSLEIKI